MTDPFVADDVLEAVLRSRAGDGAPADLHALILAAVAVDGPRAIARRSVRHPWRLLAVAAVLPSAPSARRCSWAARARPR